MTNPVDIEDLKVRKKLGVTSQLKMEGLSVIE
jgi:hypothetical protein